jgi:serine/threonine protein kinase HipA of HipAB toxin-antitoxin module
MTMFLMIGTFVGSLSWLLARARLEAQQLKRSRVTCQDSLADHLRGSGQ